MLDSSQEASGNPGAVRLAANTSMSRAHAFSLGKRNALTSMPSENVALGGAMLVGIAIRIAAEERLVTERYPEYVEYAKRTKRLVPFVI